MDKDFSWDGPLPSPEFTMVPNVYFRLISPHLSGTEVKVMNYLLAETYGWHRPSVTKTLDDLSAGSGVSRSSAAAAALELERVGLVEITRTTTKYGNEANSYSLRVASDPKYNFRSSASQKSDGLQNPKIGPPTTLHKKRGKKDGSTANGARRDYRAGKYGHLVQ